MISPTPPRARSAKYAASLPMSPARSSRPVCIEPITTRLARVVNPRSNGDNNIGYGLDSGVTMPPSPQCLLNFVKPADRAFLGAHAAAQHQVLVQCRSGQRARIRELPFLQGAVDVQPGGALGA